VCDAVVEALRDKAIAELYATGGGFCVPHLSQALRSARRNAAALLARVFAAQMRVAATGPAVTEDRLLLVGGADVDAPRRRAWRARVATEAPGSVRAEGASAHVVFDSLQPGCAACRAGAKAEADALSQVECVVLTERTAAACPPLCPTHLHDLHGQDSRAAARVAAEMGAEHLARLKEGAGARLSVRDPGRCVVCEALGMAEREALTAVTVAVQDEAVARVYEESDGLCARHALSGPQTNAVVRHVLRVRLHVLAWELEEAGRKASWPARHESAGPERTAWLRAPVQLDGRVTLSAPPLSPP
jgi:hypothetical protein